ncbi:tyrosine-type recombinase/integrase [Nocardiopsis exhalans]|uniref:Site-specific recombinase XerD n=2 Tax=Nocardiopsis TaxID=2013 RepID=A0A840WCJ9_9ACTN|nr:MULTISPECIES: tyrosine-type recombinase/integrase [Nocardiopsis]MBB5493123.1 site-specific recombinase XerD [Nocardiopsis metallicus]USY19521.1 tyrosine-type recombinase/integrase [Nocardiopsis exhalans]
MTSLESLIADYLDSLSLRDVSEHTVRAYRQTLRKLSRFVGDVDPSELTHRHMSRFLAAERAAGAALSSVQRRYVDLGSFCKWLLAEEEITRNPMDKVDRPRTEEVPVPLVDPATIHALLRHEWSTRFLTMRNRAIITVLLDTGVRVSELLGMNLADFSPAHNRITVRGAKRSGERVVSLGKHASAALRRYLRARARFPQADNPALWLGSNGRLSAQAVRLMLSEGCKRVGVPHVFPHQLRHQFAHEFRFAGGNDGDLMYLAGWTSTAMLRRYGASGAAVRAAQAHAKYSPGDQLL